MLLAAVPARRHRPLHQASHNTSKVRHSLSLPPRYTRSKPPPGVERRVFPTGMTSPAIPCGRIVWWRPGGCGKLTCRSRGASAVGAPIQGRPCSGAPALDHVLLNRCRSSTQHRLRLVVLRQAGRYVRYVACNRARCLVACKVVGESSVRHRRDGPRHGPPSPNPPSG